LTAAEARSHSVTGITMAVLAAFVYGGVPNFARMAFLNGVPALESVFFRTTAVAVVLGLFALLRGERFALTRAALPAFIFQCAATLMVSACYLASLQYLPVTLSVILFYTFPVIVLLSAPLIEGQLPHWTRFAIALLGFAGLYVAVGPAFDQVRPLGIVLALFGALGCALQFFSGRMLSRHLKPAAFGSLVHLAILPFVLAMALGFGGGKLVLFGSEALGPHALIAVIMVCLTYIGGYFFHMSSVKAAPASIVAPFFNIEPIVTTAIAVFVLKETMTQSQWLGGAMVFASLVAASLLPGGSKTKPLQAT